MQITKSEKARLGIFVFVTGTLIALILFYMVGKKLITKMDPYTIKFSESVDGLMPGANVKLNGVSVGRVTETKVDITDIRKVVVSILINHGTPIKKGMVANLVGGLSITGIKNIELAGGSHTEESIPVGAQIPEGVSQLKMLTGQAETIALKFETLLNNLLTITNSDNQILVNQGLTSIYGLTHQLDTLVQQNYQFLLEMARNANGGIREFRQMATKMDIILSEFTKRNPGKRLGEILEEFHEVALEARSQVKGADLDETLKEFKKAAKNVASLSAKMDKTITLIQEDLTISLKKLKETSENMEDFSRIIKNNPSVLLREGNKQERGR